MVPNVRSVDQILRCDHSKESVLAVRYYGYFEQFAQFSALCTYSMTKELAAIKNCYVKTFEFLEEKFSETICISGANVQR